MRYPSKYFNEIKYHFETSINVYIYNRKLTRGLILLFLFLFDRYETSDLYGNDCMSKRDV